MVSHGPSDNLASGNIAPFPPQPARARPAPTEAGDQPARQGQSPPEGARAERETRRRSSLNNQILLAELARLRQWREFFAAAERLVAAEAGEAGLPLSAAVLADAGARAETAARHLGNAVLSLEYSARRTTFNPGLASAEEISAETFAQKPAAPEALADLSRRPAGEARATPARSRSREARNAAQAFPNKTGGLDPNRAQRGKAKRPPVLRDGPAGLLRMKGAARSAISAGGLDPNRAQRGKGKARPQRPALARARNSREGLDTIKDLLGLIVLTLTIMAAIFIALAA